MVIAASPLPAGPDREPGPGAQRRLHAVGGDDDWHDGRWHDRRWHERRAGRSRAELARIQRETQVRDELTEARRAARERLPTPAPLIGQLAMAVLEIEAGLRSAAQLEKYCRPEAWEALNQRLRRRGGPFVPGNALRRVMCQESEPGLADGVAVIGRGSRTGFVAMRLDAGYGRWLVTHMTWASAAG